MSGRDLLSFETRCRMARSLPRFPPMKQFLLFVSMPLCLLIAACGNEGGESGTGLRFKSGTSLGTPVNCGGDSGVTCPQHMTCATLDLEEGRTLPICVELTICDKLTCSSGKCAVVNETSPAQVKCVP